MTDYPIHTLEAARQSLMVLKYNRRAAQTVEARVHWDDALTALYARWPDLRGGVDEVRVGGR